MYLLRGLSIILLFVLIPGLATLVQPNVEGGYFQLVGEAFAQQYNDQGNDSAYQGPLPEDNSTDLLGPIPEDNSTIFGDIFGNNFGDNSSDIVGNENGTTLNPSFDLNSTGIDNQTSNVAVPEFGQIASVVLIMSTMSILVISVRMRSQFKF